MLEENKLKVINIIRNNGRNLSRKCFFDNRVVFLKKSLTEEANVANEYIVWKYFRNVSSDVIPKCIFHSLEDKIICFEWLDNYETIAQKYNIKYVKELLLFLKKNGLINSFKNLHNDYNLLNLSRQRSEQQCFYFSEIREQAAVYYSVFIEEREFLDCFDIAINDFKSEDVLCHGDLGKSNILISGEKLKIVDYEYSLFSSRELDYGRILSSIILSFYEQEITYEDFVELAILISNEDINICKLSHLAGLQLLMRIIHTYPTSNVSKGTETLIICAINFIKLRTNNREVLQDIFYQLKNITR